MALPHRGRGDSIRRACGRCATWKRPVTGKGMADGVDLGPGRRAGACPESPRIRRATAWKWTIVAAGLLVATTGRAVGEASDLPAPIDKTQPREPEACEVTVVDGVTRRPLPGATVRVRNHFAEIELWTDEGGRARIALSGRKFGKGTLDFDVWDDGHVPQRRSFTNFDPAEGADPGPRHRGALARRRDARRQGRGRGGSSGRRGRSSGSGASSTRGRTPASRSPSTSRPMRRAAGGPAPRGG